MALERRKVQGGVLVLVGDVYARPSLYQVCHHLGARRDVSSPQSRGSLQIEARTVDPTLVRQPLIIVDCEHGGEYIYIRRVDMYPYICQGASPALSSSPHFSPLLVNPNSEA